MKKIKTLNETNHEELLKLIDPLVDFLHENKYTFFLVAGKDGTCTRHLMGNFMDASSMIIGLMATHKGFKGLIEFCARQDET